MRVLYDAVDIFQLPRGPQDAVCVTTNGCIKKDGNAVMGRGIALTANRKFNIAGRLAKYLNLYGNRVFYMGTLTDGETGRVMSVITFPTKNNWKNASDLNLIRVSAEQLVSTCNKFDIQTCYLPCPGCSNGGLDWESQVCPVIEPILDDRFIIADKKLQSIRIDTQEL